MYLNSIYMALKYSLYGYIGPKVYTMWVHGPLGTHTRSHTRTRGPIDKAQDLNLPTPTGVTPLVAASAYGQHDAVVFLLETARLF